MVYNKINAFGTPISNMYSFIPFPEKPVDFKSMVPQPYTARSV